MYFIVNSPMRWSECKVPLSAPCPSLHFPCTLQPLFVGHLMIRFL
jgi:hypothetical protein